MSTRSAELHTGSMLRSPRALPNFTDSSKLVDHGDSGSSEREAYGRGTGRLRVSGPGARCRDRFRGESRVASGSG